MVELLDATGAPFASYRYDAWGRPLGVATQATGLISAAQAEAIAQAQVLRYAGYAYDAESGLYYCSARYYDPATMQFLTKDIAKADAEESPYQYCGGDPAGRVDPSGMAYKAAKAVAYSDAWWDGWNRLFPNYDSDCANFVSQCLWAGGWSMTAKWYANPVWSTRAWENAHSLSSYMRQRGVRVVGKYKLQENRRSRGCKIAKNYHSDIRAGDVVFYDWEGNGVWDHTSMVAGSYRGSGTLVNQHTTNRVRVNWRLDSPWYKYPVPRSTVVYSVLRPK